MGAILSSDKQTPSPLSREAQPELWPDNDDDQSVVDATNLPEPLPPGTADDGIPAKKLLRISHGWHQRPTPRQIAERKRVIQLEKQAAMMRKALGDGTSPAEAKRARNVQELEAMFRGEHFQTALLALLGSAKVFRDCGHTLAAEQVLLVVIQFALQVRVTVQLGKRGAFLDIDKCLTKLRCGLYLEKEEHRAIRQAIDGKSNGTKVDRLYAVARKSCEFFEPWVDKPSAVEPGGGPKFVS